MPAAPNSRPTLPRPPAWAMSIVRPSSKEINALDAAFAAGAALAALDAAVRQDAPFTGAWRKRLALKSAAASLADRVVDETALRDALALARPGGDPGPNGRTYAAWRALASGWPVADIAREFGVRADPADLAVLLDPRARAAAPAPISAAVACDAVLAAFSRAAPLAWAVADLTLAARLGWRAPVPLLAVEVRFCDAKPGEPGWPAACCVAYARAAARACDLHAELARAAARLEAILPKLRAKGAPAAIAALQDDDAVSGAARIPGLSNRGLRRLFDRLVELGAVRELTGRSTFRLYGL